MYRLLFLLVVTIFLSCGNSVDETAMKKDEVTQIDRETLKNALDQLESDLQSNKSTLINKEKANDLIEKSLQYVNVFPKDTLSPGYLFRAGEVSVGIKKYDQALGYWERMKKEYRRHEKAPIALFLQGFTCDNQTQDINEAKKYYNEFLSEYPDHEYAGQVKELLKNIDISPEVLIKSFQAKRKSGN